MTKGDGSELQDWLPLEIPLWTDQSRDAVEKALRSGASSDALAVYARWWQFETWLRLLLYLELRAKDGVNWKQRLPKKSRDLARQDAENQYMASTDATNPLVYLRACSRMFLFGSRVCAT